MRIHQYAIRRDKMNAERSDYMLRPVFCGIHFDSPVYFLSGNRMFFKRESTGNKYK